MKIKKSYNTSNYAGIELSSVKVEGVSGGFFGAGAVALGLVIIATLPVVEAHTRCQDDGSCKGPKKKK